MKYLVVMTMVVVAFSAGVLMGWNFGVQDARNLDTVQTP